ncbi:site-specific recombinase XerD [Microterricola gilva]|uniref:Site-specific recombinase XerD n=1 Tax=Microterricola gilva TaxID=393267 RepID=A0A4Q8ALX4_9MICO|nr:site-specific integrase [Microterricola gilva]RZU64889.1 site-specific recombinase XerD [Microterricola gilva]
MGRNAKGAGSVSKVANGYRGYITEDGKRKYTPVFKTKVLASTAVRELANRKDDGTLVMGRDWTLEEWIRHWLTIADLKPGVLADYEWSLKAYIAPNLGTVKLSKLKVEMLEKLYADMASGKVSKSGKPLGASSIGNVHANIRAALNVAVARGRIGKNVALHAVIPERPKAETTSFSEADARAVLRAARGDRLEARWSLALMYGLRPAEALGLSWADVDLVGGSIRVHGQLQRVTGKGLIYMPIPKTNAGDRIITLAPVVVEQLKATRAQQMIDQAENAGVYKEWEYAGKPVGLVFTRPNGRPIEPRLDSQYWKALLASTGLPHARRYQLRHTAATLMLDMGNDVVVVAATLGHANPSFTYDTYVHPLEERKKELGQMMGKLAEPEGDSAPYPAPYASNGRGSTGTLESADASG